MPLVWHVREAVHEGHLGIRKRLLSWLVRVLPDEIIYISVDNQQRLTGSRKGIVSYNFVDLRRFDRNLNGHDVRDTLDIDHKAKVVLFLGGLSQIKGTLPFLRALDLARQRLPEIVCLLAGNTNPSIRPIRRIGRRLLRAIGYSTYMQEAQALLRSQVEAGYVRPVGFRSDVERLIAASDLVVFPSVVPHFARPVMEAGAMAKPVVASRVGGVEEVVQHGQTGLLVPPNDPEALADGIVSVLTDEDLAARLGEQGYQQAVRLFDARRNVAQILEVYERLLGCANTSQRVG